MALLGLFTIVESYASLADENGSEDTVEQENLICNFYKISPYEYRSMLLRSYENISTINFKGFTFDEQSTE